MAKIYVNGDAQEVSLPLNVSELIQQQNVLQPEMVSVQVNEEFSELPCRSTLLRQASLVAVALAIHPASTIFGLFTPEQYVEMSVPDTTVRLSIGLEDGKDLLEDIKKSLVGE